MKKTQFFLMLLFAGFNFLLAQHPTPEFVTFATGFSSPVDITHAGDDRLFIVEKRGVIKIIENGATFSTSFLNIDPLVRSTGYEQGLLGLAFHPDYSNNGYFFLNYINNSGNTVIARYSVSSTNPNVADANSASILMTISQPFSNHNGGCIKFGPDGYLYIATGDGGSGGDPQNHGQNPQSLLGKMLRIDVDVANGYGIPPDNPFVGNGSTLDEIWAIGLRNPWRFSFDRLTGDLWIGDVGQNAREEINFQSASSDGGENYGWRCYEGNNTFNTSGCSPASNYDFPIYEYGHNNSGGFSLTGGFIYRGSNYECFQGHYIFTDYISGNVWTTVADGNGWDTDAHGDVSGEDISSFGEDVNGELYATNLSTGVIFSIKATDPPTVASTFIDLCQSGSVMLTSSGCTGGTTQWFADATGEILVSTGSNYTTPPLTENTSYWVSCFDDDCQSNMIQVDILVRSNNLTIPDVPIPNSLYGANNMITSTGTVDAQTDVTFLAGNLISLENGFTVSLGGIFFADIDPCD